MAKSQAEIQASNEAAVAAQLESIGITQEQLDNIPLDSDVFGDDNQLIGPIDIFADLPGQADARDEELRRDALTSGERNLEDAAQADLDTRDVDFLDQAIRDATESGNAADILEASQAKLRFADLNQALDSQAESEQLAQRAIIRDQQANQRAQAQTIVGQQKAQAQITNLSNQRDFGSTSAFQGISSSIGTDSSVGLDVLGTANADLVSDSTRLSSNLIDNVAYLNQTFDLGGDIAGANQSILQQQANDQASAADQANLIGGITAGASVGGAVGGVPGAVIGGSIGLLAAVFDF